jgi:uncharacterized protein (DUF1501 family)
MKPNFSSGFPSINTLTRRDFLARTLRAGGALGLAALTQVPPFARRALAEGSIGLNGKKLLFIFLRGANDALNSCIPILDSSYNNINRPNIFIPPDPGEIYSAPGPCDFPTGGASTFAYANAINLGNGFNALHPSLKFLAPVYNAGDVVMVHRVGYPRQSRSHFDSQAYWETGQPNSVTRDGIFYRTLIESGQTATNPLAGISIQGALPTLFKGPAAAITNINDPTRYDLLGTPTPAADAKLMNSILAGNGAGFADKRSRDLLHLSYENLVSTLDLFSTIDFTEDGVPGDPAKPGNNYVDDVASDGGTAHYHLFPTTLSKNGGGTPETYVVDPGGQSFFTQLKGAALVLNHTEAIIAGVEMGGFDTHNNQGGVTGDHANLQSRIAWAIYGLRKYFSNHANKVNWNDLVIVTLTEFGRTTIQNSNNGTDHAEAGLMWVAGGGVKGRGKAGRTSGIIAGTPSDSIPWDIGPTGSMFGVSGRYLQRAVDYRSVLGEIIREHLGATQGQLDRIIPGYANAGESLLSPGESVDGTTIMGEVDLV